MGWSREKELGKEKKKKRKRKGRKKGARNIAFIMLLTHVFVTSNLRSIYWGAECKLAESAVLIVTGRRCTFTVSAVSIDKGAESKHSNQERWKASSRNLKPKSDGKKQVTANRKAPRGRHDTQSSEGMSATGNSAAAAHKNARPQLQQLGNSRTCAISIICAASVPAAAIGLLFWGCRP
jgi:hypothetical protein